MSKKQTDNEVTYFFDFSKEFRKSIILFKQVGIVASPMAYIQKPKHIAEKEFDEFIKSLQVYIKKDTQ